MTIPLSERHRRLVEERVRQGEFASAQAMVEAALDQMTDPLSGLSRGRLNALINEGVRDLDDGRVLTAEQVDERLAATRAAFKARRSAQ